jgi:hypothetical protein
MDLDLGGWIVKILFIGLFWYGFAKLYKYSKKLEDRKKLNKLLKEQSKKPGKSISLRKK